MFELNSSVGKHYKFTTIPNDPMGVKTYTLTNGLKLFLSINKEEPRIYTNLVVRAGSKFDPADCTGLAHYLEHMMFKGTSKIGALDWEQESQMLQEISDLYEAHKKETDLEKRAALYRKIDEISNKAATIVAPNEYDKLASALGAKGTNAYTWVEQTVYVNDIPSNELERWMRLESERFSMVALRLFHTEMETVYEEFNISQDRDIRNAMKALNKTIFPTHPYGTQTTLGEGEHLKSPSHERIQQYFASYYVPNNIGIVLAGDFDENQAVMYAEKYWGSAKSRPTPTFSFEEQPIFTEPQRTDVFGKEAAFALMAWRMPKAASEESVLIELIGEMLFNSQAGLLDLELNSKQLVMKTQAWAQLHEDYSTLQVYGMPRAGQSLEEVEALIINQIGRIAKGDFPDWLIPAVITNMKLSEARRIEKNESRTGAITSAFVTGVEWVAYCSRFERLEKVDKEEVINFAQRYLINNYAIVYKRQGENTEVMKVAKPAITPVTLNREAVSDFTKDFLKIESPRLKPEFIDYQKLIKKTTLQTGLNLYHIEKTTKGLFQLHYVFNMGKLADREIGIATSLLHYLGTTKYSAAALQQEFFKLGLYFEVSCNEDRTYISLSGLEENLEQGIELFEHILAEAVPNQEALQNVVDDKLKMREDNKKNREYILRTAMVTYAKYGKDSALLHSLTEKELRALTAEHLVQKIKQISDYQHDILYVGRKASTEVAAILKAKHQVSPILKAVNSPLEYIEKESERKVYLLDFPMVQADIYWLSKGSLGFQLEEYLLAELFNDYFGYGLSSIFFQEIRESRALGYSASSVYTSPSQNNRSHYLQAYVGTQPDKLQHALPAIQEILQEMPIAEKQIENARTAIMKRLESSRVSGASVFWQMKKNQDLGFDYDIREELYTKMKDFEPSQLIDFHDTHVKNRDFSILILGNKAALDLEYLSEWGEVVELSLDEILVS
jgi:predicted Zn-dependent peptidase